MRESNVVTKVFEVEFAPVPHSPPVDDDLGFQDEIDQEKTRVSNQIFVICLVIYSWSLTWKLFIDILSQYKCLSGISSRINKYYKST